MPNQDRNVVALLVILSAALPAWSGCAPPEEEPSSSSLSGATSDASLLNQGAATQPRPPGVDERRPGSDPGGYLVCDPRDARYCRVSRAEEGIACPLRIEDLGNRLTCSQLPAGSYWNVRQGPTCLVAEWRHREHAETCVYDPRTGSLIASRGQDACGIYCSGLRAVQFGEFLPDGCGNTRFAAAARCLEDGTEVPEPDPRPVPHADARPRDAHPSRDAGAPLDARLTFDARPRDGGAPDVRRLDGRGWWQFDAGRSTDGRWPTPALDARRID